MANGNLMSFGLGGPQFGQPVAQNPFLSFERPPQTIGSPLGIFASPAAMEQGLFTTPPSGLSFSGFFGPTGLPQFFQATPGVAGRVVPQLGPRGGLAARGLQQSQTLPPVSRKPLRTPVRPGIDPRTSQPIQPSSPFRRAPGFIRVPRGAPSGAPPSFRAPPGTPTNVARAAGAQNLLRLLPGDDFLSRLVNAALLRRFGAVGQQGRFGVFGQPGQFTALGQFSPAFGAAGR